MNNIPSSSSSTVPSIRIHDADDASALFDGGDMFSSDIYNLYNYTSEDTGLYSCSQGVQSECRAHSRATLIHVADFSPNAIPHPSADLEDIPELSHLNTTSQMYLTGHGYSFPYPTIVQENCTSASTDGGLSPSSLGSPIPSPTSSFGSSLSPSSLHDSLVLSDSESPLSPSPAIPDLQFPWGLSHQSSDSLVSPPFMIPFSNDSALFNSTSPQIGRQRRRSMPSPSRHGPVASKAMLEANGRRRRHPPQFECAECGQTFTALFSLKRHGQSHTGERPFACSIPGCTQRFFNSSDCKRHEKSRKRHKDLPMP